MTSVIKMLAVELRLRLINEIDEKKVLWCCGGVGVKADCVKKDLGL